ncbi:hypothetical protein HL42_0695 [Trichophyton rubrum]|nr:hypothetical protein HL42_0695 [Trichophyton rubrum]
MDSNGVSRSPQTGQQTGQQTTIDGTAAVGQGASQAKEGAYGRLKKSGEAGSPFAGSEPSLALFLLPGWACNWLYLAVAVQTVLP